MTTVETPSALLSVVEVANRLHVSRVTAYRLIWSGKLPALKVGGQIRIAADELETYLREAVMTPRYAIEKDADA